MSSPRTEGDIVDDEEVQMQKASGKNLTKAIKNLRTELGLTQEQYAAMVAVTWSTVSRWENGRGNPSPLAMRQIEGLKVPTQKPRRSS